MKTQIEINHIGYKALIDALGFDGMIRFIRQFQSGEGDYTAERQQRLGQVSLTDIFNDIETYRSDSR